MADEPLTELEQSRADTCRVYVDIRRASYGNWYTNSNELLGVPKGMYTKSYTKCLFPHPDDVQKDVTGTRVLLSIPLWLWRRDPYFEEVLASASQVVERTKAQWEALLPEQEET